MGNTSVYLAKEVKPKMERISQNCQVPISKIYRIISATMPEDYLTDLVNNYKDQVK